MAKSPATAVKKADVAVQDGAKPDCEPTLGREAPATAPPSAAKADADVPTAPAPLPKGVLGIIECAKAPWIVGDGQRVEKITVRSINFAATARCLAGTTARGSGESWRKLWLRSRRRLQCEATGADGAVLVLSDIDMLGMPLVYAKAVQDVLLDLPEPAGELIQEGDTLGTPALYKLGTPLVMKDGSGAEIKIDEIEFSARTLGDIEDCLAELNETLQAVVFMTRCGRPILSDGGSMSSMPDMLVEQITALDGFQIMDKVVSRFL